MAAHTAPSSLLARGFTSAASVPEGMIPAVVVVFSSRSAVLLRYLSEFPRGGLFVPGEQRFVIGEEVGLSIAFADQLTTMQSLGVVRWQRSGASRPLQAGTAIEFYGEGDLGAVLRKIAKGSPGFVLQPRSRRVHVRYLVHCVGNKRYFSGTTVDISRTGMHIACADPRPKVGEKLQLRLVLPNAAPLLLIGTVVRHSRLGIAAAITNMPGTDCDALRRLCSRVQQQATVLALPHG